MSSAYPAVFFDIGETLGSPTLSPAPIRLLELTVYSYVGAVLEQLSQRGVRLGIISNTGSETSESMRRVLLEADLYDFFDRDLLIYSSVVGLNKDSPAIFELAAERAGLTLSPDTCLFVGEDALERHCAILAGWQVAPHPLLAMEVLDGIPLRFARIIAPPHIHRAHWAALLAAYPLVPASVNGEDGKVIHALVSQRALGPLANAQFAIQPLGDSSDPLTSDYYMLRDDKASSSGALSEEGQAGKFSSIPSNVGSLLSSTEDGLVVCIPAGRSAEDFHFEQAGHGHTLKLLPDINLLNFLVRPAEEIAPLAERDLLAAERDRIKELDAAVISQFVDRYIGKTPLGDPSGTAIGSRHILHADNTRASQQLATDLQAIGGSAFEVTLHPFLHQGQTYHNVIAQLAGVSTDLVLVTAHMDSTAAFSPPYDPVNDPAPGADDDASGVAAVLAAAEVIRDLAMLKTPELTVRFVLFNAEEHGLIGSQKYAADTAAAGEKIAAVFQMDMIGYNVVPPSSWEVHAGFLASSDVQAKSVALANRIHRLAPAVAPELGAMQLYQSHSATDRDPAEGRSDHAPFQQRGFAACVATEDFFTGPSTSAPEPEGNPNYHRKTDTLIDPDYAGGIARCVVAAAWVTACPTVTNISQGETHMAMKLGSGTTKPGATAWKQYTGGKGVYLDVDTSACKFSSTPKYFTTLGGRSSHWATTGATSIYLAKPAGFRVYVRWSNGANLTPAQANRLQWHINWFGIES